MNPKRKHKRKLLILPMVKSHYPSCLQCFPTQENLTTKTLNPKVTSFVIQVSLTSSSPSKKLQRNTYIVHSNRHNRVTPVNNRVTIEAYDTRYNGLIQKLCHTSTKSCHDFPPAETIRSTKKNRVAPPKIVPRFWSSQNQKFEVNFNIVASQDHGI